MAEEDSSKTVTTILLTGFALLLLAPISTDLFDGKLIFGGRILWFSIGAALAIFFAYFPYLPDRWKAMFVANSVDVVRLRLAPVARSGWSWFILIMALWGYLAAGPLINYYAQQVAIRTVDRSKALSAEERAKYQRQIEGDERRIQDLTSQLDDFQKRIATTVSEIEKRDWVQDAIRANTELESAQHSKAQMDQQREAFKLENRTETMEFAMSVTMADSRSVQAQINFDAIASDLKTKLDSLLALAHGAKR